MSGLMGQAAATSIMQELKMIQQRLADYENELQNVIRQYGDEMTMSYFSDRFGHDHPRSARADEGVRIQQHLLNMKVELVQFARQFDERYPPLNGE